MDQDKEFLDLKAQVAAQAAEIARLRERLEGVTRTNLERDDDKGGGLTSRRGLFKLAGAAAVGAAGASLLSATPASATTGTMMFGTSNDAGADSTLLTSAAAQTLEVRNSGSGGGAVVAVLTDPTTLETAVFAETAGSGQALVGESAGGYGLVGVGGLAPLVLVPAGTTGPPTTGAHVICEVFVDHNGALFQCVGVGTPGTWVRVGFNPLTPVRILDTRNGTGGITGPLTAGQTVNLTVAGMNGVPTQASAVVMNATIAEPTAASFLTIWPEGVTRPLASNLNWTPGQIVPNLVTVKLGTGGGISIFNNLGDVQVILDLAGFYS